MSHGHTHHPTPFDYDRRFALAVALNLAFVLIEAVSGILAGSLALLADAGHNLGDVVSLLLAWGAFRLAASQPTERRTYGLRRATILASLLSAVLLYTAIGAIAWEAIGRIRAPAAIHSGTVIAVASAGVLINTLTALLFAAGRERDLNLRAAFLHMAADAAVSVAVVIAGLAILLGGWRWIDPAVSLLITLVILISGWSLLRDSLLLGMDAVPRHIDPGLVREYLRALPDVREVHDLHIWGMSTTETALTVHLQIPGARPDDAFLATVAHDLEHRFRIHHATIQIERGDPGHVCPLAHAERV